MFTDDTAFWATGKTVQECNLQLQQVVERLEAYFLKLNINLNPQKTSVVPLTYTNWRLINASFHVSICVEQVHLVDSARFLDVVSYSRLSFREHLQQVTERFYSRWKVLQIMAAKT